MLQTILRHTAIAAASAAALLGASAAQAAALTFNDRSAWNAAVSSPTTVDFNGFTGTDSISVGPSYTEGGVRFDVTGAQAQIFGSGPLALEAFRFPAGEFYGNGYLEWQNASFNTLTITLPREVQAIGFDFSELLGNGDTFTIVVDGETFTVDTSEEGALFFGLMDTDGFTTLTITDAQSPTRGVFPTIDNFSFAGDPGPTAVPEPASLLLLLAGALPLACRRRKLV
jgi:hypothetical protein